MSDIPSKYFEQLPMGLQQRVWAAQFELVRAQGRLITVNAEAIKLLSEKMAPQVTP